MRLRREHQLEEIEQMERDGAEDRALIDVSHAVTNTSQFISIVYDLERKAADAWAQQG